MSIILILIYLAQLAVWGVTNFFLPTTTNNDWAFLIGFWGMNFLLIFITDFFHVGIPKTISDCCSIIPFLIISTGYFFTLYYKIYWISIIIFLGAIFLMFSMRYYWLHKFSNRYYDEHIYLKEESTIRLSIYVLPVIFLSSICGHFANVTFGSLFFVLVCIVYFVVSVVLITTTYIMWNKIYYNKSFKQVWLEIIWLILWCLIYIFGIGYFRGTIFTFILPILSIIPILIFHKEKYL